jgi:succinate dehydrogenase/fumarate reductase cytochrome b subunit (b558 family)
MTDSSRAPKVPRVPSGVDAPEDRRRFVLRRLHGLTGIVPIGIFLVVHLWTNAKVLGGPTCFNNDVAMIQAIPALVLVEIVGIFLPLAFHAGYGIVLALESRPNVQAYPFGGNWMYLLQRASGIVALLFLIVHLCDFRIAKALGTLAPTAFLDELGHALSARTRALAYLFGTTASIFHFANGIRTFLFGWGITVSARAQRGVSWAVASLGAGLWFLGANTILYFATGGGTLLPSRLLRPEPGRDLCAGTLAPENLAH